MYAAFSSVRAAREQYFAANGFSEAAYNDDWVKLKIGPLPVAFPNTSSRKRAIPMHDLHHIATGYPTTITGEAEIAAWEIGGSCADYRAAWLINSGGFAYGLVLAPRRVYRAFVRGRKSRNLYHSGWDETLLDLSVAELRSRIGIDRERRTTLRDRLAFFGWALLVSSPTLLAIAVAIWLVSS